ncbi:MAG: methylated-DNA--[protein]-cysteine S-methyltransferase [Armatimonadetes bacterium]|nr:methylated-DNA--[protein]-cysteine S-methyltransferase [Armatimonadota bacterium]
MKTYCVTQTDLGYIALAGENGKLAHSSLPEYTKDAALSSIKEGLRAPFVEDKTGFSELSDMLKRYACGECVDFSNVAIDLSAFSPFYCAVLLACQRIPYGQVMTYAQLARAAGSEKAARAAGSAMANNETPIIIPCHRVIASGGKIGGFSSDLEWKRSLLRLEGVDI